MPGPPKSSTKDPAPHTQHQLHIQFRLLQLLAENPRMSQRDLSRKMGVALGRVNFCLTGLKEKGFIKLENFKGSTNHLRYAYILTPSGFEEKLRLTVRFLKRRLKEYEEIKTQIQDLSRDVAQTDPTLLKDLDLNPPFKQ
ncbi:MAG: MarR family EPS-associated transcriptional regulator [Desulfotignum sp.]|nr:MarR family EPS-associated transcriptional regulator [Desulfotignum sp.]